MFRHSAPPLTTLPAGYREVTHLSLNERGRMLWLNLWSLLLLGISAVPIYGTLLVYHEELGGPLVINALPNRAPNGLGLLAVILVLPLHEWIHGLTIRRLGHRPRYGIKLMVLFATSDGALFRRSEFVQIALAPLVVITLSGELLMLFLPYELGRWLALALAVNAAGAIGDLWMTVVALRYGPSALIRDEEDSMRIFARVGGA